jgi:hypothetical protein
MYKFQINSLSGYKTGPANIPRQTVHNVMKVNVQYALNAFFNILTDVKMEL